MLLAQWERACDPLLRPGDSGEWRGPFSPHETQWKLLPWRAAGAETAHGDNL